MDRLVRVKNNVLDAKRMKESQEIADELRSFIVNDVNEWLARRGMHVIQDDPEREPWTIAAGNNDGAGHVSLSFYFSR